MDHTKSQRPSLGFNLVSWVPDVNTDPEPWMEAIAEIKSLGIRRVTIICYQFLDQASGTITYSSDHGLVSGPTDAVVKSVLERALVEGFDVGILPFVEVDNPSGIGHVWRGSVAFSDAELDRFFSQYTEYILGLAEIARNGAARFYLGSELETLTKDPHAVAYWERLVDSTRSALGGSVGCRLSYASNWNEMEHVPFWGNLDEIGVDAYFPLASAYQARGRGRPSEDVLVQGWFRNFKKLRQFSTAQRRPVTITEWGIVPLDLSSARPWDWRPSHVSDPEERSHAYRALLRCIRKEGEWLSACDLWHWSMPGNYGSEYGVQYASDIAEYLKDYTSEGG